MDQDNTKIIPTSCIHNCGGRCLLKAHVKEGILIQLTTDDSPDTDQFPQARACLKGRAQRQRLYDPDRLKYPMKRVGERGEGRFNRISWDEAFDTITGQMQRIKQMYGNEAIHLLYGTGVYGQISQSWITPDMGGALPRFLHMFGGYLGYYNTYSSACFSYSAPYTYGVAEGNSPDDLVNAKLIVLFAENMAETRMGGAGAAYYLKLAKDKGAKIVVVDPRYSDTASALADEWIPIRPTTDNALIDAMAYVMLTETLHDQTFLDTYCLGFDEEHMPPGIPAGHSYRSYLFGLSDDKIVKTPEWAERITGIPRDSIVRLARQIGRTKPACLLQGLGWQRHAYGEQPVRALPVLAAMTGSLGKKGGGPGLRLGGHKVPMGWVPAGTNPVKASISCYMWPEAILRGKEMTAADGVQGAAGLATDIKMIWSYASNILINQHSDCNGTARILQDESKCEFILVHDVVMTPSAKFADILLPDVTHFEREDITTYSSGIGYAIYHQKVVEPMYECKDIYTITSELANRLGFGNQFTEGKTEQDWLRECVKAAQDKDPRFPAFEDFRRQGIYKAAPPEPVIAYEQQIADPVHHPFQTPSGKIEIFSPRLWEKNNAREVPAVPKYISAWEGPDSPLTAKYPLQCIGYHCKQRVHSTFDNIPWMEEAGKQEVWISPGDAEERGIMNGEQVKVFNDRGAMIIAAKVTPRIMPGVAAIPQGAWWSPDSQGIDRRGNINTITKYHPTPLAKGNPQHTNLVQIEKA
ncbi:DMSO/selenate family reductase complex A subunit [Acetonema longum]|uniref:Anaerobic dimethyl sulfoxide reductase, A subunit, DmsA/YnfE n=1 Tax=Acetonema longum DSM 6540 TaxID=1009370 RepID=F7NDZ5_9FIRM|nr:DMSO/selenate family reductase complex A subunit [Acetonema longum]EGO65749.1 anaerobic dimethyl sulfoxide reductase, A subunit, DmsA/YnfE [Acetonema longum DSM 6540]